MDNMTIFIVGWSLHFVRVKMQLDLSSLTNWLTMNKLKLNVGKTKSLLFNQEGLVPNVDLIIDNPGLHSAL